MPPGPGQELIVSEDLRFRRVASVELERPESVRVHAALGSPELFEGADEEESPGADEVRVVIRDLTAIRRKAREALADLGQCAMDRP
jgi:hypothetical protein